MAEHDWDAMAAVGRIVRPQGTRGEVVVAPETDFGDERFRPGARVFGKRAGSVQTLEVRSSRPHQGRWVIGFVDVGSIEDAETWRGVELRVPADALRPLDAGAYYVHDLVGCEVQVTGGETVGRVTSVYTELATPLLGVGGTRGEVLIPLTDAICRTVDVAAKVIVIDPPAGLLEVN